MPILYTSSPEETKTIAESLAKTILPGNILCFFGDLGAGKTTFIKALAIALGTGSSELVNSPTFQYLNIYQGKVPIYHFDLYRLKSEEDFILLGFDEFFQTDGIVCIEWAEKIKSIIPKHAIHIQISHGGEDRRKIEIIENS
jgi:tRNA threonylcarbamoyladenosine biosynthesis protein TsaE